MSPGKFSMSKVSPGNFPPHKKFSLWEIPPLPKEKENPVYSAITNTTCKEQANCITYSPFCRSCEELCCGSCGKAALRGLIVLQSHWSLNLVLKISIFDFGRKNTQTITHRSVIILLAKIKSFTFL